MAGYNRRTWMKVRLEYETKGTTVAKLSSKHGMCTSTIDRRIKVEQWIKLKVVKDATFVAEALDIAARVDKIHEGNKEYHKELTVQQDILNRRHDNDLKTIQNQALLIKQQEAMIRTFNPNGLEAHKNHQILVNSNKSLDNANAGPKIAIDNSSKTTNNTQINLSVEESKENLENILGAYD